MEVQRFTALIRRGAGQAGAAAPDGETMRRLAAKIARTARANGMEPCACAEPTDFGGCGVARARCVDAELLGRIGGIPLRAPRDPNQRAECGCAVSVDLGAYNTCPNGCVYCYANFSPSLLRERLDRRVRRPGDVTRRCDVPVLAALPARAWAGWTDADRWALGPGRD